MRRKRDKTVQPSLHAEPGSLRFYLQPYKEWQGVKGYSPTTLEHSTWRLLHFVDFCEERGVWRASEASRQVVERYQRYLYHAKGRAKGREARPLGTKYQAQMLMSVKGFFKWLARERYVLYNPTSELELPKLPKTLPRVILSPKEAEQVLNSVEVTTPLGVRDRALLELLYSTGIRRMEAANLLVYDVDAAMGTVFIKEGKGRKDRVVPIGERALLWLQKYLEEGRPHLLGGSQSRHLFLSVLGERMKQDYLGNLVAGHVQKAGVPKRGGCHMFRHTCATLMLENGADVRFVQAMLGHSSLETTQIYTHVSIQKLKEIHKATHPAKMKNKADTDEDASDEETSSP